MRRLIATFTTFALLTFPHPAGAETPPLVKSVLAEGSQRILPVGPLVWQTFALTFLPGDPPQLFGDDAGFTWVRTGAARVQFSGEEAQLLPAGAALASQTGVLRRLEGVSSSSTVWLVGLGGPVPPPTPQPPRLIFRSEPLVPPGAGGYRFRLSILELSGPADLAPEESPGSLTVFVEAGALFLQAPAGAAVLRVGTVTTLPADQPLQVRPLGSQPARLVTLTLLAGPPATPVSGPPSLVPDPPAATAPFPLPLLPSGSFPRRS
ncbi:MAG: hypothetical protein KatS3mg061_3088 [Dehalococcoidia bacterium]|nr:MAG: hypothetical protein KatS3mg061_3088 [Dehalococcoidia bacterium]